MKKNAFYAQSGGPTSVINASACGIIEEARKHSDKISNVYVGRHGIVGALNEDLIDTAKETSEAIHALRYTPAAAFGSCRHKLKKISEDDSEYKRLIEVFEAHNISYFFYNGGNDSQDTTDKISQMSIKMGYPLTCVGIPKTIDNDLPMTDCCPGFGSVAKYVAISTKEAALDIKSMCTTSTKVFILEVMGRHAGWIAAAGGLAASYDGDAPHMILFPEIVFDENKFTSQVKQCVEAYGFCVVVASEGIQYANGKFVSDSGLRDAFGHAKLGGVAPALANIVRDKLGYKEHWAVSDYLQRSARHIASKTDVEQAYALGAKAVEFALAGKTDVMVTIQRKSSKPYTWDVGTAPLSEVCNVENKMPEDFIDPTGYNITQKCRDYLLPLIQGEDYPPYQNGLPAFAKLKLMSVEKKLLI
ncbi:MAG: 6-phosphofructokinase [Gammaproteobacteria bacterium RIFOXYB2_FULL_38_6]|nr:MAG: 6-phosphofructokinase [Gammaproteobacteria bacterium RIFOXYB2_FULL_38_6]